MLVCLDDGRIDHAVLIVRILRLGIKDAPPDTRVAPARVAKVHDPKVAKACGKIPPCNACAVAIQHGLHEQAVVLRCHAHMALSARQ